jgi:hypothetical protein
VDTAYSGTVILISSDHYTRPSDYTFTQSDSGTHIFSVSLFTAGVQTLLVRDAANGTIMATVTVALTLPEMEASKARCISSQTSEP